MSEYQRFLQDKGELLRYDYDLNENSLVWDVGGYKGEFAENIFKKFRCCIHIFEPVFYNEIASNLAAYEPFNYANRDPNTCYDYLITIFPYGLSNKSCNQKIAVQADSTSLHKVGEMMNVELKDIHKILSAFSLMREDLITVDLIKINIEGEEYNLLERMLNTGIITRFKNIQVQFHNFIPNCEYRKNKIQMKLLKTHELVWRYDYIWESWRLK